jgi:tetratricopeptide (TPR) repeat protein
MRSSQLLRQLRSSERRASLRLPLTFQLDDDANEKSSEKLAAFRDEIRAIVSEQQPLFLEIGEWEVLTDLYLPFYFFPRENPLVEALLFVLSLPVQHINIDLGDLSRKDCGFIRANTYINQALVEKIKIEKECADLDLQKESMGTPVITIEKKGKICGALTRRANSYAVHESVEIQAQLAAEAEVYEAKGKFALALKVFEKLLGLNVKSPLLFSRLGMSYARFERYEEAFENYAKAIRYEIKNNGLESELLSKIYYKRGCLGMSLGGEHLRLAIRDFDRVSWGGSFMEVAKEKKKKCDKAYRRYKLKLASAAMDHEATDQRSQHQLRLFPDVVAGDSKATSSLLATDLDSEPKIKIERLNK